MKKNLIFLWGGVLLFAVSSCSVDNTTPVPSDPRVRMEFTAGTPGTRTAINSDNSVSWTDNDAISVFDGTYNNEFTISSGVGSSSATFSGTAIESDTYYALYPYSADAACSGNIISSVLPENQFGGYNTFTPGTNPSVAVSDGNTLAFHNVAGLVRVTLPDGYSGERTVRKIQLSADQSLAGPYTVDMSGSSYSAVATAKTPAGVSLAPLNSDSDFINGTEFYLVVLPGSYTNLKMSVIFTDGSYMTGTIASAEITAGTVFNAPVDPDNATTNDQGLYGLYQAGIDIEIGGESYNIADYGEAQLIVSDADISTLTNNCGVFFIAPEAKVTWSYKSGSRNVLLIGNDEDVNSKVTLSEYIRCNAGTDENAEFVVYNIELDATNLTTTYVFLQNYTLMPSSVRIIDSKFLLNDDMVFRVTNSSNDIRSFKNIDLQGNIIKIQDDAQPFIMAGTLASTFENINLQNNIFYEAEGGTVDSYNIFVGTEATINKVTMENNTFVNIKTTNGFFRYGNLKEVVLRNNLIYMDAQLSGLYVFRPNFSTLPEAENYPADKTYPGNPENGTCEQSIVYDATQGDTRKQWFYGGMNRLVLTEETEMNPLTESPFSELDIATETFTVKSEYSSYGAQR